MDARLLDYYNRELTYMHELGAEFAQRYPKIAGRLGMRGIEVSDPYVERLLEGFSFLTARIQLKMEAEFPPSRSHCCRWCIRISLHRHRRRPSCA